MSEKIEVKYKDELKTLPFGINVKSALKEFNADFTGIVAMKINEKPFDISQKLEENCTLVPLMISEPEGIDILRHSTSHVMALAVKNLFPETKVAIGPSIENGFYYDFDREVSFTPEDLEIIEKEMKRLIKEGLPFERKVISKDEALKMFNDANEIYKTMLLEDIFDDTVSIYKTDHFIDLCRGPHIDHSGKIKAFKLLDIAGAYWRGNEKNKMLQRIYGTAFATKEELNDHLEKLAQAKERDHRKLGKELDLFSIHETAGAGLIYWHPKGAIIRKTIEDLWRDEHIKRDYEFVYSPHIARANLFSYSGHLDFYRENMYSPMDIDGQEYFIKPMNCPFHIMIYKTKRRSYRELPIRWAELGTVYRYERSGVLHGLLRVRGFTQDDAHIICTKDQLLDEVTSCVEFSRYLLKIFGFEEYDIFLATRPEKFAGDESNWDIAESTMKTAIEALGLKYSTDEGGAVFYGPKIDIKIKDALGRFWQGPTIQFDFNLPERFGMKYMGPDGKEHIPFMVHRAMLGSMERFMGCLIEHYGGAFPLWLSPVQVKVLTITDDSLEYAKKIVSTLKENLIRSEIDIRGEKIGAKIHDARKNKIPYMAIVGTNEAEKTTVSVRHLTDGDLGQFSIHDFTAKIKEEIETKGKIIFSKECVGGSIK